MGRCRYTATAVEDILNGQRSTTAMGIEICFTHANRANPAKRIRAIFREIREREIITLVFSSDAARNVPTPLTTHSSLLKMSFSRKKLIVKR